VLTQFRAQAKDVYNNIKQEKQQQATESKVTPKENKMCFLFTKMTKFIPDEIPGNVLQDAQLLQTMSFLQEEIENDQTRNRHLPLKSLWGGNGQLDVSVQIAKCYTRTKSVDPEEALLQRLHKLHGHQAYETIARQNGLSSTMALNMPACTSYNGQTDEQNVKTETQDDKKSRRALYRSQRSI